jgi:hypothetical protein
MIFLLGPNVIVRPFKKRHINDLKPQKQSTYPIVQNNGEKMKNGIDNRKADSETRRII